MTAGPDARAARSGALHRQSIERRARLRLPRGRPAWRKVELVAGPVTLATPAGVRRHGDRDGRADATRSSMAFSAQISPVPRCGGLVMAAAVARLRPADPKTAKIKKRRERSFGYRAREEPRSHRGPSALRRTRLLVPVLVAFALLETGDDAAVVQVREGEALGEEGSTSSWPTPRTNRSAA